MAFRPRWNAMRVHYDQHFPPVESREVTVRRVVNIVERRTPVHSVGGNYDRGYEDGQWFDDDQSYRAEECPRVDDYLPERYYDDNPNYVNFQRNSSLHLQEPHYQCPRYDRDDLRHQIRSSREDHNHFRHSQNIKGDLDRSSGKRKSQPPDKQNVSPESDKGSAHPQKNKPVVVPTPPTSVPAEEPPQASSSTKALKSEPVSKPGDLTTDPRPLRHQEKATDFVPEKEEEAPVEAASTSMEPETTQDEELTARRSEAIKAKALEIEKHYRQDCETFVTVVKMLVSKEPTLENLLNGALNASLSEMKQNCFTVLRHYVKELDEALDLSDNTG
ncbi:periphilin-1-like isoform X2 [Syngnathoides biaculeatus]|uniref:periphilin-1-like isoform X2 n=1 Tax=Syngnathoides biaculeatus TaxID=300417 RepID=UPI002ADDA2C7|nr:periphilin-1-like isoform X2 [Syngnathoides biaculeatus]